MVPLRTSARRTGFREWLSHRRGLAQRGRQAGAAALPVGRRPALVVERAVVPFRTSSSLPPTPFRATMRVRGA